MRVAPASTGAAGRAGGGAGAIGSGAGGGAAAGGATGGGSGWLGAGGNGGPACTISVSERESRGRGLARRTPRLRERPPRNRSKIRWKSNPASASARISQRRAQLLLPGPRVAQRASTRPHQDRPLLFA